MPFTFCHPAIILPLTKSKKLSTSALILGSTAPDFEYFIRMDLVRTHSHDFWAMFYFNLPLTLCLFFIFQFIVKQPLINHLPNFLYSRFNAHLSKNHNFFTVKKIIWIVVSTLIGIFSHLLWDSFTHKHGFFEDYLPILLKQFSLFGKSYVTFQFSQTWCSIIGGIYILYFIIKIPITNKIRTSKLVQFWGVAFLCSFMVIYLRQCDNMQQLIATSISSGLIGLTLSSFLMNLKTRMAPKIN
jgi:hypothetical protein